MRRGIVIAVVTVVVLLTGGLAIWSLREREPAGAGGAFGVQVVLRLAEPDTFRDVVASLGVRPAAEAGVSQQTVVAKVTWSGAPETHGAFIVLMLDKRVAPPRPLDCRGGVTSEGPTPAAWSSALDGVAERYDWLAAITPIGNARGGIVAEAPTSGVFAPAQASGTMTAWCSTPGRDYVRLADPASEVIVALIYQGGDTQVRWARRVAG